VNSALVHAAALNNATWCDAVCRARGAHTRFASGCWLNETPSPPFFPVLVTLRPATGTDEIAAALDSRLQHKDDSGIGVKDSFALLDLGPRGLHPLLEAQWLWKDPTPVPADAPRLTWRPVTTDDELARWERAWWPADAGPPIADRVFAPTLLGQGPIALLAAFDAQGAPVGGCALTDTGKITGLTCAFLRVEGWEATEQRAELMRALRVHRPWRAICGYESGEALQASLRLGWHAIGGLRVWVRD
jgi:hypothetical protein